MNKMNKFFLMGTMALSGMAGLTACSSDDDVNGNGNDGAVENGVVKTQFALNVPYASNGTRMTEGMTQGNGQTSGFRGISDMRLFAFHTGRTGDVANNVTKDSKSTSLIILGTDKDAMEQDNYRRIYRDVMVPIGTDHFVFYGTATGTSVDGSTVSEKFNTGILASQGLNPSKTELEAQTGYWTPNKVFFNLVPVAATASFGSTSDNGSKDILENLKNVLDTHTEDYAWNAITTDQINALKTTTQDNNTDAPKLKHAQTLFNKFKGLTAGSATSVVKALEDLRNAIGIDAVTSATSSNKVVKLLETLYVNTTAAINKINGLDTTKKDFPRNLHLPDGVAQLTFVDNTAGFKYVTPNASGDNSVNIGDQAINFNKITYPASLNYTVATTVKANDNVINGLNDASTNTKWPAYNAWETAASWNGWGNEVTADSRSIGLEKLIQYGVANFKFGAYMGSTELKDNASLNGENVDRTVPMLNGSKPSFKITAVLIGGQPNFVGWDYNPAAPTGETLAFDQTIYDNVMNCGDEGFTIKETAATKNNVAYNYTLVLDNKVATGTQADVVYVTLELENNSGMEFFGKNGIVPKGGKFYLVGKLDVNNANTKDNSQDHIFVQDHTTVAKFGIGSLKNAYNVIPDLRASSISLGLAVDLTWQNGMEFDYTID